MSIQGSQGGSLHSFGMYDDMKEPINLVTLKRLQTVALAIKNTQEILDKQKLLLEGNLSGLESAHNLSCEIKNLEILNKIKSKKVDSLKRMCAKKRIALLKLNDEQKKQEESHIAMKTYLGQMDVRYESIVPILDVRQKYLHIFTQLGRSRRRILLKELIEIFQIKLGVHLPTSKSDCPCTSLDSICGVHLPHFTALTGHQDVELSAALGYTVHLLSCISQLLDYPLRYPIHLGASTSHIQSPKEDKSFSLFGVRWRADRDRLNQAVTLLGRNIAQLRLDCGFPSPHTEQTLRTIEEWIRGVLCGDVPIIYHHRPWSCLSSPAVLVDRDENEIIKRTEEIGIKMNFLFEEDKSLEAVNGE